VRRIVVAGASRGIGAAVAAHYVGLGDDVIALSRSPAAFGHWLQCDLSDSLALQQVAAGIAGPIHALLYTGGTWEEGAFTETYAFEHSPADETTRVIAVNLTAPILLTQGLLPALREGSGRVILIGALSALDHSATAEVANSASKYGLRGAAQALHMTLAPMRIGVTVINPGNVATDEVMADIAEGRFDAQVPIPMADLLAAFDFALNLSPASVVHEINLGQISG
jgi:3-oxoacyl-[acyl-carrier protein] reductase